MNYYAKSRVGWYHILAPYYNLSIYMINAQLRTPQL
jgi:hypothetical protein